MDRSLPLAVLALPDLVLAVAAILEFGIVFAAAVGDVVASSGRISAAIDGLAIAGARGPGLSSSGDALVEICGLGGCVGGGCCCVHGGEGEGCDGVLTENVYGWLEIGGLAIWGFKTIADSR